MVCKNVQQRVCKHFKFLETVSPSSSFCIQDECWSKTLWNIYFTRAFEIIQSLHMCLHSTWPQSFYFRSGSVTQNFIQTRQEWQIEIHWALGWSIVCSYWDSLVIKSFFGFQMCQWCAHRARVVLELFVQGTRPGIELLVVQVEPQPQFVTRKKDSPAHGVLS